MQYPHDEMFVGVKLQDGASCGCPRFWETMLHIMFMSVTGDVRNGIL